MNDPIAFWRFINNLGPKKSSGIPWEVWGDEGNVITNHDYVLDKWKKEFQSLLTPPSCKSEEQKEFKERISQMNTENELKWIEADRNPELNGAFTEEEVQ